MICVLIFVWVFNAFVFGLICLDFVFVVLGVGFVLLSGFGFGFCVGGFSLLVGGGGAVLFGFL